MRNSKAHQVKVKNMMPLSFVSDEYMQAHLNFRLNLTNQGGLILGFLQESLQKHAEDNQLCLFKLASIGSGTGIIDVPLVEHMQQYCSVTYLGIEPNDYENSMAKQAMAGVANEETSFDFFAGVMEDLELTSNPEVYDAIVAVHVTYYSADIKPMIQKALNMLHPEHGRLVTVISANTPQNELFKETTKSLYGYMPTLAYDYKRLLDDIGVQYETRTIEGAIDISGLHQNPNSKESKQFLDFFLHADSSTIAADVKERYVDVIMQAAIRQGEKLVLPHIAEAVSTYPSNSFDH